MSNEYIDVCRLFVSSYFHPAPAPSGSSNPSVWAAYIDFDAEVTDVSTAAAVWCTSLPDGARTTSGSRQFRTLGPTVSIQSFDQYGQNGGSTASGEERRNAARAKAVIGLYDQLMATRAKTTIGNVIGATNASPIVVTYALLQGFSPLATGSKITIANVTGNTAANGDWTVTVLTASTLSLNNSVGNGSYTSGGTISMVIPQASGNPW